MAAPKGFLVVPIGENPDGDLRMLELDADDNLKVALAGAAQGLVGTHGWIAAAWQKNPLLFGYTSELINRISDTALSAGDNSIDGGAVPAGEIWVVTNIGIRYDGTTPTTIVARIDDGSNLRNVFESPSPISTLWEDRQGWWVLAPAWKLNLFVGGATLNDDAYLDYSGFKIDIDQ